MRKKIDKFKIKLHKLFGIVKTNLFEIYTENVLWISMPFILMEVFLFVFRSNINYSNFLFLSPILFSIAWILLFVGISINLKKWIGKLVYIVTTLLFLVFYIVNGVYYSIMKTFFDFTLLNAAGEGAPYMMDALKNCNRLVYVSIVIIIIFFVIGFKKFENNKKADYKKLLKVLGIFIAVYLIAFLSLGKANSKLTWSSWRNPKNIYNAFNDANKSMKISGFYEYTIRNFYITFFKSDSRVNEEDLEFLNAAYEEVLNTKNKFTGKLKGKNLVIIQLEGTDSWLFNKNDTPTMYSLMNNGLNFTKHYSFYNGGGSTFNSEFAVNTGYVTPLSFTQNAYAFSKNSFPNSLAHIFKNNGYSVNAFHMNTGEYYSRTVNYKNWGYDNYYGLIDHTKYTDESYELDRELILNEEYSELMFNTETPFVDYIIAYSGHLPFTNTKGVCKMLYEEDNKDKEDFEFVQMSEEECVRRQARETDYMVELLINKLKEKELLNNTAIVIFTDHYLYTLNDQTILDRYKDTSNNLINNTPWFIYSNAIGKGKLNKVTSQLNILPTLLNLYGFEYNVNNYIAKDALDPKYEPLVFFNDYSWYDGNVYVENGSVTNNKKINLNILDEKNEYVNYLAKKNDLTLKYNYLKK